MLSFLRKIRKNLIETNKVRQYIVYAIGEILLVMIGILLALQVNNWNEEQKSISLEKEILQEIQTDVNDALESLQNDVNLNDNIVNSIETVLEALDTLPAYHDSLDRHFSRLTFSTTFTINQSAYDNLKNVGFQVIRNDSLRKMITKFYEADYTFLQRYENNDITITRDYFTPLYLEYIGAIHFNDDPPFRSQYRPADFEAMRKDLEFKRLLTFLKQNKLNTLHSLEITLTNLRAVKRAVDQYLNQIQPS